MNKDTLERVVSNRDIDNQAKFEEIINQKQN